jgi:signal transduction histidine kinase
MSDEKKKSKKKSLFAFDITGHKFLKKYAQIIYAVILMLLIPAIIIGNTLFVINKFRANIDEQLRRRALIISELIDSTLIRDANDLPGIQDKLTGVYSGSDEIRSLDIMIPEGDNFKIIASPIEANIGRIVSGTNNVLAWHNDRGIAHLTKPSSEDIRQYPELRGERYWNVVFPIHDEQSEKLGLINLKMSLRFMDDITTQTLTVTSAMLVVILVIIVLLLLINTRLFEYAFMVKKLQEVDQMKDEFFSTASHELKAPITAIQGYISMFVDGSFGKLSQAGAKGINIVNLSIKRLEALVEDLLNVSRIEQGRLEYNIESVNLNEIIEQTIDELKIKASEKNLQLDYTRPQTEFRVRADQNRLRQVLVNIAGNAIKYTPDGSISISVEDEDKKIKLRIKDTGIGMSAKDRERLFSKFYRVRNKQTKKISGTGLGLWITKEIVTMMGGEIYVDSIEGSGTEVSFTLRKV